MNDSEVTRIHKKLKKEIERVRRDVYEKDGQMISCVEASRRIADKVSKFKTDKKKWKFPEFT